MNYYKKEIISNRLFLPSGGAIPFEAVGESTGVLATEDAVIIAELDRAMKRRVGGVRLITAEIYEELKKNPPVKRSSPTKFNPVISNPPSFMPAQDGKKQAAVVNKAEHIHKRETEPAAPLDPAPPPLTAKMKEAKAAKAAARKVPILPPSPSAATT